MHPADGGQAEVARRQRKKRVLTQQTPAITYSIADAVVIKNGALFFLCEPSGRVPYTQGDGFGLYYHDCRFLDGYEIAFAGSEPNALVATAALGYEALLELTNDDLRWPDGTLIPKESIGVRWRRVVDGYELLLRDRFIIRNYAFEPVHFPLSARFRAGFDDMFVVRGMLPPARGTLEPPTWRDGALVFRYRGIDGLYRSTIITFRPAPAEMHDTTATFDVALAPQEAMQIDIAVRVAIGPDVTSVMRSPAPRVPLAAAQSRLATDAIEWLDQHVEVETDSLVLHRLVQRSLRDLGMLCTTLDGRVFFAAGVPWFVTLFGRDSLITALQMLAFDADIAAQTLRLLASLQGTRVDPWREEQPGKILHELRVGELANAGEIPHTPYYGSIDATPLFLIVMGEYVRWTGDLGLVRDLRENIERALDWMVRWGDLDGDGYLEYRSISRDGLVNQGWKDSGDAIVNADGSLATPPIALVEVQGYAYLARLHAARLLRLLGARGRAAALEHDAHVLRARFNRDFWLPELGFFALALQGERKRPAAVISSNPGQALWTGIVDPEKAARTAERLMAPDMFGGYGIRTLATGEVRYNPLGYHLGTVWPHDNSIIAAGLRRYGFDVAMRRVAHGVTAAAIEFPHDRLPELYGGFARGVYGVPVSYPVADHPQAWGAGAVPFLLRQMLGLEPDALNRRLHVVRPMLPDLANEVVLRGVRVGGAEVDLRFRRGRGEEVAVEVGRMRGELTIDVVPRRAAPWRAASHG